MGPHLAPDEQGSILSSMRENWAQSEIHVSLSFARLHAGIEVPGIKVPCRFMKGATHWRGNVETRGRNRALTRQNVVAMDRTREKTDRQREGHSAGYVVYTPHTSAAGPSHHGLPTLPSRRGRREAAAIAEKHSRRRSVRWSAKCCAGACVAAL